MRRVSGALLLKSLLFLAVHKVNNYKGSIYMVCDYMDHDLTGLMERRNYKFTLPQVPTHAEEISSL